MKELIKEFEHVLFERDGSVAYLTLNDPANKNPVTVQMMADMNECLNVCERDDSIRCVVLRGAGGAFSAGGNIKVMKERIDKGINQSREGIRAGGEFIMRLRNIAKPTIAWIEGAAAGVGMSIAMACDFSIAAEDTTMVFAFVNIAYCPDGGIVHMLSQAVSPAKATELLMGGRKFKAKDAAEWGLITAAVPAEELEETVQKYIKKYSNGPTVTYGQIKTLINRTVYAGLPVCQQNEVQAQYICSSSEDHKAAVNAFLNKEKPVFQGK